MGFDGHVSRDLTTARASPKNVNPLVSTRQEVAWWRVNVNLPDRVVELVTLEIPAVCVSLLGDVSVYTSTTDRGAMLTPSQGEGVLGSIGVNVREY